MLITCTVHASASPRVRCFQDRCYIGYFLILRRGPRAPSLRNSVYLIFLFF